MPPQHFFQPRYYVVWKWMMLSMFMACISSYALVALLCSPLVSSPVAIRLPGRYSTARSSNQQRRECTIWARSGFFRRLNAIRCLLDRSRRWVARFRPRPRCVVACTLHALSENAPHEFAWRLFLDFPGPIVAPHIPCGLTALFGCLSHLLAVAAEDVSIGAPLSQRCRRQAKRRTIDRSSRRYELPCGKGTQHFALPSLKRGTQGRSHLLIPPGKQPAPYLVRYLFGDHDASRKYKSQATCSIFKKKNTKSWKPNKSWQASWQARRTGRLHLQFTGAAEKIPRRFGTNKKLSPRHTFPKGTKAGVVRVGRGGRLDGQSNRSLAFPKDRRKPHLTNRENDKPKGAATAYPPCFPT